MIISYDDPGVSENLSADICVIGAGAAGITIALKLMESGSSIIVLSGGETKESERAQRLYRSEIVGHAHDGVHTGRCRAMGGTTTLWGGQAFPFSDIDFGHREWVQNSGWPITSSDLEPYYDKAREVMLISSLDFYADVYGLFGVKPPEFDPKSLQSIFTQWSTQPNFAAVYGAKLNDSASLRVVNNVHVTNIQDDTTSTTITHVDVKSFRGKYGRVSAKVFILAAGAIETARLLLASDSNCEGGLGNANGLVGRYFQDHVVMKCAKIVPTNRKRLRDLYDLFYYGGVHKLMPKFILSPEIQVQQQILGAVGYIDFEREETNIVSSVKALIKSLKEGSLPPMHSVVAIANQIPDLGRMIYRFKVKKRSFAPDKGDIWMSAHCEQEPLSVSRIMLSKDKDEFGMRRSVVDWQVSDLTYRTIKTLTDVVSSEFERLDLGRLIPTAGLTEDQANWKQHFGDTFHHMGTTRMNREPEHGVVDCDLKIHGLDNMYVASCSVFPTSSYANPTFTMLALALRLSDHVSNCLT
jgi:choline dehydrogenase-like flavoprotein